MSRALLSLPLALLFLSPSSALAATESADSAGGTVALIDAITFNTAGIPKSVREKERFFETFLKELGAKGWTVLAPPLGDDVCIGISQCLRAVAVSAGTGHTLRLAGEGSLRQGYTIKVELYSTATTQTERSTAYCDVCNTDRIASITADFAAKLLASAKEEAGARQRAGNHRATQVPSEVAVGGQPVPATAPPVSTSPSLRWVAWTMVGVGAGAMVYGGWALSRNGDSSGDYQSDSPTTFDREIYSSKTIGYTGLIGGGLLALAGTIWLIATPSRGVAIAASPNRVSLSLRF